ncbi:MAG: restriction endonuclease [Hyphomicrobiales bacterium]|nr:restriction endonuclease [Hyphomicrobiales bacterium]
MAIPDYQSLMLPVLKKAAHGEPKIGEVINELAIELGLTDEERAELLPSGKQTTFANRVHWAKTYLKQAGLVGIPKRAHFTISDRGRAVLSSHPDQIDNELLAQFDEFNDFKSRQRDGDSAEDDSGKPTREVDRDDRTPDEVMRSAHKAINAALGDELLDRLVAAPAEFFERVIVSLLLAMGYGGSSEDAGRAIGRSGDDGVDGVIDQDPLGLDRVYIQAKRYRVENKIGAGAIRDFFGSLDMHKASKGLFVTTSSFSAAASATVARLGKRIVLIDGKELAQLMIRNNVGCKIEETLHVKRVDEDFFE